MNTSHYSSGEHLSICYTDPLWGTSNRRHHLMRTKYFECNCVRCYDPSELSTYFDAVRCTTRYRVLRIFCVIMSKIFF